MEFFWSRAYKLVTLPGIGSHIKTANILSVLLFALAFVGLLILSKTGFYRFIPITVFGITSVSVAVSFFVSYTYSLRNIVSLAIALAVTAFFHLIRNDTFLKWEADVCILSASIFLVTGLFFEPLSRKGEIISKILYVTRHQQTDIGSVFGSFLHIPSFVWGGFIFVLVTLPVIYYSASRDKELI
ncbi:MAG: hypothetical protein J5883_07565 [Clostridiales bacterium]|nr:hypothetical protein [Clostridiales bacterium]